MDDLQQVYKQIINEETKAKRKIDDIGRKLKNCNRLHAEYLRDVMEEAIAYLNGIHIAADIVFKAIHK